MHAHNFAIVVVLLLCTKSTWKINFPSQTNDCNRYGYHTEVMARSQLQALLLQRVPSKRIVAGKVLGMIQNNEQVTVRCSDGKTYEGDILIAADGAFSNIRHSLYWTLDEKKQLPKADATPMSVDLHIISGCTKPLDPAKYPVLLDAMSEIQSVQLPDKPYAVSLCAFARPPIVGM